MDKNNIVDLVIFMGQSNMAGRGVAAQAPIVPTKHGYEFRAISDPTKLYDIIEPFGQNENKSTGINEPGMKTGSLVSAFVAAYYNSSQLAIVGVSASKGNSSINQWQSGTPFLEDAIDRFARAKRYLLDKGYTIRRRFMVWCQGEADGKNMPIDEYKKKLQKMMETMFTQGVQECFIIQIGNNRDYPGQYDAIQDAQAEFCNTHEKAILVSNKFSQMDPEKMMKDFVHYTQMGYNIVGTEAGLNTAFYIENNKKALI